MIFTETSQLYSEPVAYTAGESDYLNHKITWYEENIRQLSEKQIPLNKDTQNF